ncbi:MATH domain and coiled-coil domain-containing protein At2g42465-like [Eutrema salsugineum]|uniref:MATH domain and coiled-coil domain-containing protein At2g42465-like n=1 Tax=Eutrema salsugineum TaxID=72664 RepID=UPI000CED2358|nr:MATH domain and coiled-coil domain-containing protein At2g42465-like [Eutrema salsugineum]XP_024009196.1 MATH domain and coiled-coil domain-containing protein At2g42465-like [Eutrema salsugineum]
MRKALSWDIKNFSKKIGNIQSPPFSSGGCKWLVTVNPKGKLDDDHVSLFLEDANLYFLRRGWKRRAWFRFVLLNESGKELYRSPDQCSCRLFCAEAPSWGYSKMLPLTKLEEKGFLEKNKLTIEVYINVVEVVHHGKSTESDTLEFQGFHITSSQAASVADMFIEHPDLAVDVKPKNQGVKTAYMNLLLGLIETLSKSPQMLSMTELSNAQSELTELTESGFRLDWLKSKLEEISLERNKALSDGSWVQHLEERVKNLELPLSKSAKVSPFVFIDFLVKRFFFSCFSLS